MHFSDDSMTLQMVCLYPLPDGNGVNRPAGVGVVFSLQYPLGSVQTSHHTDVTDAL